jgi:exopolyphosphatase / guanosine-5'-triphosphate,3'-diphosphate pyrophosphatase
MAYPSIYASLDIGSNTVRLLIAEKTGEKIFRPIRVERRITRLGGNFSLLGYLHPEGVKRTLEALRQFAAIVKKEKAREIFAVATGVVREAKNGARFLTQVRENTEILPRLLSGEEEAKLMLQGVLWGVPGEIPLRMVVDIGGWSTEVLWVEDGKVRKTVSAPLGAVSLCENFLKADAPTLVETESLDQYLKDSIHRFFREFEDSGWRGDGKSPLVGTAGTLTTLAAIDLKLAAYDPQKITGHQISRRTIEEIFSLLAALPKEERRLIPGLEEGREDLILSGSRLVIRLMEFFGFKKLLTVDSGLLEGVLLDGLAKLAPSPGSQRQEDQ